MKRKTIDASREVRLWIGQVIIPAFVGGMTLLSIPEVRNYAGEKIANTRNRIKNKFDQKKG